MTTWSGRLSSDDNGAQVPKPIESAPGPSRMGSLSSVARMDVQNDEAAAKTELSLLKSARFFNSSSRRPSLKYPDLQATRETTTEMPSHKMALPGITVASFDQEEERHVLDRPDPEDGANPQNWPPWKKRVLFFALMSSSILCDG